MGKTLYSWIFFVLIKGIYEIVQMIDNRYMVINFLIRGPESSEHEQVQP